MADPRPIKQSVEVEADTTKLKKHTEATKELGDTTEKSGRKMSDTSRDANRLSNGLGALQGGISNVIGLWSKFVAGAAGAIAIMKELIDTAKRSADAIAQLGTQISGFSANVGGSRADRLIPTITSIAKEQNIGIQGREQLFEALTSETDVNTELTNQEIIDRAKGFAQLQRATGIGGTEAQNVTQGLRKRLGYSFDEAIDRSSTLLNSGFTASSLSKLVDRTAEVGGEEFLNLAYAARGELDLSTAEFDPLISALTRQDANGGLAPELIAAGITKDQSLTQRVAAISQTAATGGIDQAGLRSAIGGAQNERLFNPLVRALPGIGTASQALAAGTVEDQIASLTQSEYVSAAERARTRELRVRIAEEQSGLGGIGELYSEGVTELKEQGGGSAILGGLRRLGSGPLSGNADMDFIADLARRRRAREGGSQGFDYMNHPERIPAVQSMYEQMTQEHQSEMQQQTVINIGSQVNLPDDPRTMRGEPADGVVPQ